MDDTTSDIHNQPAASAPFRWEQFFTERRVPGLARLEDMLRAFSPAERMLLYGLSIVMGLCVFALLAMVNSAFTTAVPAHGGALTEGAVGTPRFVNPLLAQSDPDRDLSELVYSGLMRATPDNRYIKDLASDVSISEDGTIYIFTIRSDARFQDGTPVTSADVAYTIAMAQNPDIKSPQRADWDGVAVETPDDKTVKITLPHPYAPFMENATLGILPKHLWQNVAASDFPFNELNTHPVGSGPFRIRSVDTDSKGTPQRYVLAAYTHFTLGAPYLNTLIFNYYPNDDALFAALAAGKIESIAGVAPGDMGKVAGRTIVTAPLPRIFGVFFNQAKAPALADNAVRKVLARSLDKKNIIDDNLFGYGVALDRPMLADAATEASTSDADRIATANSLLDLAGWKVGSDGIRVSKKNVRLSFSIATADAPELAGSADAVARTWKLLGADVSVKVFSVSDLTNTVIRPRDYGALLFGEQVGRANDLYSFWHSSQRNDPGLNLALYTSVQADKLLADARRESDPDKRAKENEQFADIIAQEHPAVFLFAPEFVYAIPSDLSGVRLGSLTAPAERFLNVYEWHRQTEHVWDIFIPQEQKPITY